jgi:hypothetical protein
MTAGSPGKTEIRPRERNGSALVVSADNSLRGRIQPFQAIQQSANVGRVPFAAQCRWYLECESEPLFCQTHQHPADGHRIPLLAATKGGTRRRFNSLATAPQLTTPAALSS